MAGTGVLVTMHGAGLMNEIFLPPGSVVIEIFPPHVKHVLYERMSHNSGLFYFKVRHTRPPPSLLFVSLVRRTVVALLFPLLCPLIPQSPLPPSIHFCISLLSWPLLVLPSILLCFARYRAL